MQIGIAGTGAVGLKVAEALAQNVIPGCELSGIAARTPERERETAAVLSAPVRFMSFDDLADRCELVVEALPPALFEALARPVLKKGKLLVVLSAS
ncbi:aspartate dehydrogenase [Roseibium hamelinense]|uniref:Aspartate dehydrogenase n=1 Tax=Roseibium hamelinense TaxID=150831 RepID=A0A562SUJ5_9HYPH|nr:NAD(P)-binding domain-containing protein [Roseibium hamelinense]TWI84738.1 aspartate dehydrogenase [Roseibium hamelinense]